MVHRLLRIEACTRQPYAGALFEATTMIGEQGGWLVDQKIYSNMLATINFALPEKAYAPLVAALAAMGFTIMSAPESDGASEAEIYGQLSLTFLHNDPDLRRDVPPFG